MTSYSRAFTRSQAFGYFMAADKDAPGGGGTLKDQLKEARDSVSALEGEKSQLSTDLEAEKGKVTKLDGEKARIAQDLKTAQEKVTALEGEKSQLKSDLLAEQEKVKGLEEKDQTLDGRAAERAAANGHTPVHTEAAKTEAGVKDGEALYAEYKTLSGREKTAFYKTHEKTLEAYGKAQAKAGN